MQSTSRGSRCRTRRRPPARHFAGWARRTPVITVVQQRSGRGDPRAGVPKASVPASHLDSAEFPGACRPLALPDMVPSRFTQLTRRFRGGRMSLREKAEIVDADGLRRIITRIAHEVVERNKGVDDLVLVGIRRRGVPIASRMAQKIREFEGREPSLGSLDITLYRDDLSTVSHQPVVGASEIPVDINGKIVVLVDDVLYTGRTVRAAMDALIDFGRPRSVQLAVVIDRGHRELPIRADYVGKNVPTSKREVIGVKLAEIDGTDSVVIKETDE